VAPETNIEMKVAGIWRKAFNIDRIGLNDDFFDLGGDSLTATLISTAITDEFDYKFQPSILMTRSMVAAVASLLEREVGGSVQIEASEQSDAEDDPPHLVAIRAEGELPPLFIVHGRLGVSFPGPHFVSGLDPRQPVYFIQALGYFDDTRPPRRIEKIAEIYLATMRRKQPVGPLNIGSFCGGGVIATEIAAKLVLEGNPPASLILVDPPVTKALQRGKAPGHLDILHRRLRVWWKLVRLRMAGHGNLEKAMFAGSEVSAARYQRNLAMLAKIDPDIEVPMRGISRAAYNALQEAFYSSSPRLYTGPVDMITSREIIGALNPGDHPWSGIMPNMRLHIGADTHSELFRTESGSVARKMQECVLAGQSRTAET
jgi:thioesterase domain-containing protein/acyl carrier protein